MHLQVQALGPRQFKSKKLDHCMLFHIAQMALKLAAGPNLGMSRCETSLAL